MSFWTEALGASVRYVDAAGVRTRIIEAGDGPAVFMTHGLTGHAEGFIRNVVPIAEAGYHVYAVDAVGHGYSAKPEDVTYNPATFVAHLMAVMDSVGVERAHFIGQSLGAWTAWRLALAHPERVLSLTSATGAGFRLADAESERTSREVHARVGAVSKAALDEPTRERVRARLEWLMADPGSVTEELVETRYAIFNLPDSRQVMGKVNADLTSDDTREDMLTEADLMRTTVPVLILWTDSNPTTPASVARRAAELVPGARFELIENAGHWPQFEQADAFNRIIIDFLSAV